jgi:hypothetical protein
MSQNDDITADQIPDILAGTMGTEANALSNDHDAVMAALQQDPNLLAEVMQPGFVEVVNELAGDAAPTLGQVETVGQSYQDSNGETMTDAYNDLLGQQQAEQPPAPSPIEELQQIEHQLEQLESEINPQPIQEYSSFEEPSPFESAQAEPGFAPQEEYGGPGGYET